MASRASSQYRPAAPARLEQRRAERHLLSVARASVRKLRAAPVDARLHDISIYGCRMAIDEPHPPGERLWLRFAGGMPVGATVVWSEGGFTACRFDAPLSRAIMRALVLAEQ